MRSDCSKGSGEHGEFAYSFRTRSDSQRQWDFMSSLNQRKAGIWRKEEAAGIGEPTSRCESGHSITGWRRNRSACAKGSKPGAPGAKSHPNSICLSKQLVPRHFCWPHCLRDMSTVWVYMQYSVLKKENKTHVKWQEHSYKIKHHIISLWLTMETVTAFVFSWATKITAVGDCSHEIKRRLILGRKAMTNLDNVLKRRDIT